jgi:LysR family transcriptional regulator, low CO2-responsive transcriptional regulator
MTHPYIPDNGDPALARYDNKITLQKLQVYCAVVELGGFGRAAEHLGVTQPVVTAHVQSLQRHIGAQLLYRDVHQMKMTAAGERVYRWARTVLLSTGQLMQELDAIAAGSQGGIAIAASNSVGSYILPAVLAEFRSELPMAEIQLVVAEPARAINAVDTGECALAVIVGHPSYEHPRLAFEQIATERIVLVAAPEFEPETRSVTLEELAEMPLIASPRGHAARDFIDAQLAERGVLPRNVVLELGHPEAMKLATGTGIGASLLFPSIVRQELEDGVLREIAIDDSDLIARVFLVLRRDTELAPIQAQLADVIRVKVEAACRRYASASCERAMSTHDAFDGTTILT